MMKKLLVLALVLGIVSLASAQLSYIAPTEVEAGSVVSIQVVSDTIDQYDAYVMMVANGNGSYVSVAPAGTASNVTTAGVVYYADALAGFDSYQLVNSNPNEGFVEAGVGFIIEVLAVGPVGGVIELGLNDGAFNPVDSASITIVPEPATMVLLGLGALVLRRKK